MVFEAAAGAMRESGPAAQIQPYFSAALRSMRTT
jgi:hypothetical protein